MKLLIVDDEELTRKGLVSSIDAERLGIDSILLADDGVNGLELAKKERPDIVLCDVRMPRLNGIGMLAEIQKISPDVSAIFMSGYSDKDYLKSAIKMGAVNYIEKPIDSDELHSAIQKAIAQNLRRKRESEAEEMNANQAASSLAYYLTMPYYACSQSIDELSGQFYKHYNNINKFKYISTIIVKLKAASETSSKFQFVYQRLRQELAPYHLHILFTEKRLLHLVYHIYSDSPISTRSIDIVCNHLQNAFADDGDYYIAVGDVCEGIKNAYHSYESAVIVLQKSFFFEPCTIMHSPILATTTNNKLEDLVSKFKDVLDTMDKEKISKLLDDIYKCCFHSTHFLPNQVKTTYFSMFTTLYELRNKNQLMLDSSIQNNENLMDFMDNCFSYSNLHNLLVEKVNAFINDNNSNVGENKIIYLIKNYIANNYSDTNLSVKDISDYAHLSVSYLCTFFKSETGTTLNQYITEYRMERAKQLLVDPRNKITEISTNVGYNDGNYFGKSFKKIVGLSPSEYREKVMR